MRKSAPLVLMILDGWGYKASKQHNAIATAHTPHWDHWWSHCPHALLTASGQAVGLPDGQMGNSEVGHMHIGAGRVCEQDFTRINKAIHSGAFAQNTTLLHSLDALQRSGKSLHVIGLLSPGGVHSHEDHLFALLAVCHQNQCKAVNLHLFLDGRDCPPQSALDSLARLHTVLGQYPEVQISSIAGRYYAMDRDQRWDRVAKAYAVLTDPQAVSRFHSPEQAVTHYYQQGITDEFIPPTAIGAGNTIEDEDVVLYFNFRADRARALTQALVNPAFDGFARKRFPKLAQCISMTAYEDSLKTTVLFPPFTLSNTLGEVVAAHGLKQLRIAETEKYAHVTFFFNGGSETCFPHEDRVLIPSPKVATYDLQPQMSAEELTTALVQAIHSQAYDLIICNYANADMVGHSGDMQATVQSIECLDACMGNVVAAVLAHQGNVLITADHGNAEIMFDDDINQPHTAHTSEPVPFLYLGHGYRLLTTQGSLTDVAPTALTLLDLPIPCEMSGHSLLEKDHAP